MKTVETGHITNPSVRSAGPDTLYYLVRGIVGDSGTVVRPSREHRRARTVSTLLRLAWLPLGFLIMAATLRADETCSSPYLARIEGQEEFAYVWMLGDEKTGDGSDKLVTVGVKPGSPRCSAWMINSRNRSPIGDGVNLSCEL